MNYSEDFISVFNRSAISEGGFQNDPEDRGNWTNGEVGNGECKGTNCGISAMSYPELDIEGLSMDQIQYIYWRDWWVALNMDLWRPATQFQLFDAAINHGFGRAVKILQKSVGATPDGIVGPLTKAMVLGSDIDQLMMMFLACRIEFMAGIKTFDIYGRGWSRRIAENLRYAAEDTQ